jgi:hypothetical protein
MTGNIKKKKTPRKLKKKLLIQKDDENENMDVMFENMSFEMCGYMSNGKGMMNFYRYDLKKMKNIMKFPLSFEFMNYLIITFLDKCFTKNANYHTIYLTLKDIQNNNFSIKLTENMIDETLFNLQSESLIRVEKIEDYWNIQFI